MNKKCIICKFRNTCFIYQLGGLRDGEKCSKFRPEPEITEEEQERQQKKVKKDSLLKKLF